MSLWKFSNYNKYGNVRNRIIHTEGSQLSINPKGLGKFIMVHKFLYEVDYLKIMGEKNTLYLVGLKYILKQLWRILK